MADIRIKDLTTTASSSASDDFIAIDGTTNGTRKLNAFSPTFGGNATVTGTLTVNSTSTLTGATVIGGDSSNGNYLSYNTDISGFCGLWMRQSSKSATNYVLASNGTSGTLVNSTGASLFLRVENTTALEINTSRNVLIPTTTASTTTSSGALVVSGGVGVGGDTNIGGTLGVNGATTLGSFSGDANVVIAAESTGVGYLRWRPTASATNAYGFSIGYDNTNNKLSFLRHDFSTAGVEWLSVARTTGVATFAASIAIGNTVNTVSPTSPNRTITMVIGGTTYYIHAKTTND